MATASLCRSVATLLGRFRLAGRYIGEWGQELLVRCFDATLGDHCCGLSDGLGSEVTSTATTAFYEVSSQEENIFLASGADSNLRNDARPPTAIVSGTKNWELLPKRGSTLFSPRHSHATTVFKCPDNSSSCLWLTGGYSDPHRSFDLRIENENADVWYSKDGKDGQP